MSGKVSATATSCASVTHVEWCAHCAPSTAASAIAAWLNLIITVLTSTIASGLEIGKLPF